MTSSLKNHHGSVFLLALTVMTVVFILAFSVAFFTGNEDYASAMSYEREVAFNLAESAVEEFVARLKNSLNHNDNNNQLYKVLRDVNTDVSKEIPLKADQVSKLTAYTRETARQLYGIQFGREMVESEDFIVDAVIKLKYINPVEATSGSKVLYKIKQDRKEKQGELKVNAKVVYKGHLAKVSLTFLIRVVKTFIPPFNYFTLFVKDGSIYGNSNGKSNFNTFSSSSGVQGRSLRLDHGWNSVIQPFDPIKDAPKWETMLAQLGEKAQVPPGRIYLGQNPDLWNPQAPVVLVRSTNGCKLLAETFNSNLTPRTQLNAQDNFFLPFDILPWMGLKDFSDGKVSPMALQGLAVNQDKKFFNLFGGWDNDAKIQIFNVGAGDELLAPPLGIDKPSFINCFRTYSAHIADTKRNAPPAQQEHYGALMPEIDKSGLHLFGVATPKSSPTFPSKAIDESNISPTLVYGDAYRQFFRGVRIKSKDGKALELPFIDPTIAKQMGYKDSSVLNATEAKLLFLNFGVLKSGPNERTFIDEIFDNWDKLPKGMKKIKNYQSFMSQEGMQLYNLGLGNFLNKLNGNTTQKYDGALKDFLTGPLGTAPYPYGSIPKGMDQIVGKSPMREFYEGNLWNALPDGPSSYLMDFYFIPRSTEDFFRGRTTVAAGGVKWDRFQFKYINKVKAYLNKVNNQTLELNGVLALNDSELLELRNLKFKGKGVIYSSPMMGGGKVVISGDFVGADTDLDASFGSLGKPGKQHMMTIIAPQIIIDTSQAQGNRCFVEANLISVSEPLKVLGAKPVTIKGTVVTPSLNLEKDFHPVQNKKDKEPREDVIIYNPLNGIWRNRKPELMDSMYVAKIVTGGVGKFEWSYERTE